MMFPFLKTAITNLFREPATEVFPNPEAEGLGEYRGRIAFNPESCVDCGECIKVCAPIAITRTEEPAEGGVNITRSFDLTSCTFCGTCQDFCEEGSIKLTKDYHMVAEDPADLVVSGVTFKKDIPGHIFCDLSGCIFCGICAKTCPQSVITVDRKTKTWKIDYEGCVKCGKCITKCPKKVLSFSEEEMVYPEPAAEAAAPAEEAGGELTCDLEKCIYCGICKKNCPQDALEVDRKTKTWKADHEKCVQCGLCIDKCPKKALSFGGAAEQAAPAEKAAPAAGAAAGAAGAAAKPEAPKKAAKPKNPPVYSEGGDDDLICDLANCIYGGICKKNCPVDAIEVDRKTKTWKVDHDTCIQCGMCVENCPKKVLSFGKPAEEAAPAEGAAEAAPAAATAGAGAVAATAATASAAPAEKAAPAPAKAEEEKPAGPPPEYSEAEDGQLQCHLADCIYCGICAKNCPMEAITVDRKTKTWKVDYDKCVMCAICNDKCPKKALDFK